MIQMNKGICSIKGSVGFGVQVWIGYGRRGYTELQD